MLYLRKVEIPGKSAILSRGLTFMSHQRLYYIITVKHKDTATLYAAFAVILDFEHKNDVTIIIKLHRAAHLRLVALYKSLTMLATSFLRSKCNINIGFHGISVKQRSKFDHMFAKQWLPEAQIFRDAEDRRSDYPKKFLNA